MASYWVCGWALGVSGVARPWGGAVLEVKLCVWVTLTPVDAVGRGGHVGWPGIKLWIHCYEFVFCGAVCP